MGDVVTAVPKKIIICCDGTWQSSVTGKPSLPSNITRIARTIAKAGKDLDGKVWQQVVFYDAGIGTTTASKLEASIEGATGEGLVNNVLEAYNFVVNNYSPGDKVYCFGFSRGAFTARAVAGMITDFGVFKPQFMKYFPSLFAAYKKNLDKRTFRKTKEYFEWYAGKAPLVPESKRDEQVQLNWYDAGVQYLGGVEYDGSRFIELVGVFDTVGSLGLGDTRLHSHASSRRQYEWLNVKWNPYIKHAFHALALDERRQPFLPTLYYIPNDKAIDIENEALKADETDWPELIAHRQKIDQELKEQRRQLEEELLKQKCARKIDLVQVWFTGVHINVGGGRDDAKTDFEGLANITFAWMIEQCRPYLAFEDFTNDTISNYLQRVAEQSAEDDQLKPNDPGLIKGGLNAISGLLHGQSNEKMVRVKRENIAMLAPPMFVAAYWAGFRPQDSYSLTFEIISAPANRAPGTSKDMSTETSTLLRDLGDTNEYIHPSVKYRLDKSAKEDDAKFRYKCKPLEDFQYAQKNGVYAWFKKDDKVDVSIPEWPILAALEPEDDSQDTRKHRRNSEMVLIDSNNDKEEVTQFLSDHATAWKKVHP